MVAHPIFFICLTRGAFNAFQAIIIKFKLFAISKKIFPFCLKFFSLI